jgi:hypothetical protein
VSAGLQVVWPHCSVTNPRTGEDEVYAKGDMLPDYVDDFTRFVLTTSGGARLVEAPDPALVAEANPPEPVLLAEHLPPGEGTREAEVELERARVEGLPRARGGQPTGEGEDGDQAPAVREDKATWQEYAVRRLVAEGRSEEDARAEVEPMSKEQLVGRFGGRR